MKHRYSTLVKASSIGFSMVMCIMIPCFFGIWLDSRAGTSPLFMILFMFFGIASAIFSVSKISSEIQKELDKKDDFKT